MKRLLGIDIGGTKCAAIAGIWRPGTDKPLVERRLVWPTPAGPETGVARILEAARELGAKEDFVAAGISCGGPLDGETGLILSPPNLPGWDRVPICALLSQELGTPVRLRNDADACALAEFAFGAGQGCRNMVFLTFGTGLGAGLILNGQLYSGASSMAGEAGHMLLAPLGPVGYGKAGSFEGFCSGGGLAQLGRLRALERLQAGNPAAYCPTPAQLNTVTALSLAQAARAGDEVALAVYRECGTWLGRGLANLVDLLNPDRIVIGSIYARCRDLLEPAMAEALSQEALPRSLAAVRVLPARLGEELGDLASLSVAAELMGGIPQ